MLLWQVNRYASNKVNRLLLVNGLHAHPKMIDTSSNLVLKRNTHMVKESEHHKTVVWSSSILFLVILLLISLVDSFRAYH